MRPKVVCDRSLDGRADRSGRDLAAITGRVSVADSDCATHAAAVHAVSCRTSLHLLPAVRQRGEPGRSGGCRHDIDCAGRLSYEGGRQWQRSARVPGSVAAAELMPACGRCAFFLDRRGVWRRRHCRHTHWHGSGWAARRGDPEGPRREHPRAGRELQAWFGECPARW